MMKKITRMSVVLLAAIIALGGCASKTAPYTPYQRKTMSWRESPTATWQRLQLTSKSNLLTLKDNQHDPLAQGWLTLALITKQKEMNIEHLSKALIAWQREYPSHPANRLLPNETVLHHLPNSSSPRKIAILLPQSGAFAKTGNSVREGFLTAYYANLDANKQQEIRFYDTGSQSVQLAYNKAVKDGAEFVIGPILKDQVLQLMRHNNPIPILALNYTGQRFARLPKNFYEFGLLPEDEVSQIVYKAYEKGHQRALVIAPDNEWGQRLYKTFKTQWVGVGGKIQGTYFFSNKKDFNQEIATLLQVQPEEDAKLMHENNNKYLLEQQRRQDFDVIFLFSKPNTARTIVPLLRYYYASNVPIYATSAIYKGKTTAAKDVDLNGVIVCDIPWKKNKSDLQSTPASDRLFAVGQDAYLLSQSFSRLVKLPNIPLYGNTGALVLATHQVHRRLPCVPITNGHL